jgi:Transposase domain (DUF772)
MVALLYLKHAFNLSDEQLVQRWSENVQWQFFSGMAYYEPRLPCDATRIGRFRRVLGEAGVDCHLGRSERHRRHRPLPTRLAANSAVAMGRE